MVVPPPRMLCEWRTWYGRPRGVSSRERSALHPDLPVSQVSEQHPEVVLDTAPVLDEDAVGIGRLGKARVQLALQLPARPQAPPRRQPQAAPQPVALSYHEIGQAP